MSHPRPEPGGKNFDAAPYSYADARRLASDLGLAEPVAIALVRRGYTTPEAAREFLEASEIHDPFGFEGMAEAVDTVLAAIEAEVRITVHGDYDVDGVCSTSIMVGVIRELGGVCDWLIPDRQTDGYGLTEATVEKLIARETELLITVDCGITSVAEVAAATAAGIEVIVTDHHSPGDELPAAQILHPGLSGYVCPDLCGAGVAYKLATALRLTAVQAGVGQPQAQEPGRADLDLVALATVADMVPLKGENRALVRAGIDAIRRAPRPGIAALLSVASVEPEHFNEGDIGFRLGPRINAAGRLYRADAGVELMLSDEPVRSAEIAAELDKANHERRGTEREVLQAAEAAARELEGEIDDYPALVLAGEGWHAGVIGIVASRIAEKHHKPAILIAIDEHGVGKGSGRSIPGFDLLGAMKIAADPLDRFGGHKAAAGLEIQADRIDEFRDLFCAAVAETMPEGGPVITESIDAVVGADGLGKGVAEQLQSLGPFGLGNPNIRLLVPWARMMELRPMGEGGKHARFNLQSGAGKASGVAFGIAEELAELEARPYDFTVRLEMNQWNGASEPRVVLGETYEGGDADGYGDEPSQEGPACQTRPDDLEWWSRFEVARSTPTPVQVDPRSELPRRELIDRRGGSTIAGLVELISSGVSVLAVAGDAERRRVLAAEAADPARFGRAVEVACRQCDQDRSRKIIAETLARGSGLVLTDWDTLGRLGIDAVVGFEHVFAIDPPGSAEERELAALGSGFYHAAWGQPEMDLARRQLAADWDLRPSLGAIYKAVSELGESVVGADVQACLVGEGRYPRTPELAGRCVRVLEELSLVSCDASAQAVRVVSSEKTDLERSAVFVACRKHFEKASQFLQNQTPAPAR